MLIYRAIKIINSYEEASSCLSYNSIQNKLYADNPENVTPMLNMQVCRPRNTALIQLQLLDPKQEEFGLLLLFSD